MLCFMANSCSKWLIFVLFFFFFFWSYDRYIPSFANSIKRSKILQDKTMYVNYICLYLKLDRKVELKC